jgi:hypothetical protein
VRLLAPGGVISERGVVEEREESEEKEYRGFGY